MSKRLIHFCVVVMILTGAMGTFIPKVEVKATPCVDAIYNGLNQSSFTSPAIDPSGGMREPGPGLVLKLGDEIIPVSSIGLGPRICLFRYRHLPRKSGQGTPVRFYPG